MQLEELFKLSREQLISLDPRDAPLFINDEGIVYIAKELGAYWQYDYEAAKKGKVGYHAELKSKRHSNGFFDSKILLQYPNILEIIASQLVYRYKYYRLPLPEWVAGIPNGAKALGKKVARMMGAEFAQMEKVGGKIKMITDLPPFATFLFVEDFCTQGTGFKEAAIEVKNQQPTIRFLPYELVILNRGKLNAIKVENAGSFLIVAAAYYPVADWDKAECPPCKLGSIPIKPKATDENWGLITNSQK